MTQEPRPTEHWLVTTVRKDTAGHSDYSTFVIDEHPVEWMIKYGRSRMKYSRTKTSGISVAIVHSLEITADQHKRFNASDFK